MSDVDAHGPDVGWRLFVALALTFALALACAGPARAPAPAPPGLPFRHYAVSTEDLLAAAVDVCRSLGFDGRVDGSPRRSLAVEASRPGERLRIFIEPRRGGAAAGVVVAPSGAAPVPATTPTTIHARLEAGLRELAALPQSSADTPPPPREVVLDVRVDPVPARVGGAGNLVFVSGRVVALTRAREPLDLVLVIDGSGTTDFGSGFDVDGDGEVGGDYGDGLVGAFAPLLPNTDPADSVLNAELLTARTLLSVLDLGRVRVGIVRLSGYPEGEQPDAEVLVPLTADRESIERGLDRMRELGSEGRTNTTAAIEAAVRELRVRRGAKSTKRKAEKRIVMLTDGRPNLPVSEAAGGGRNRELAVAAAKVAASRRVRIDVIGSGDRRDDRNFLRALVTPSSGTVRIRPDPRFPLSFDGVFELSDIDVLELRNATNGRKADVELVPDGRFGALVEAREGENTIEIQAVSSAGARQSSELRIEFAEGSPVQPLDPEQLRLRNALLARRLEDLIRQPR